ncbi:MAG: hypothetical protein NTW16_14620 [Bacteroidetes bacterium]|nr:hypothetical protein [Bacteroidota bacterium]
MSETSRSSQLHRSRSRTHRSSSSRNSQTGYLEPVFYFSSAILLLILANLIHSGTLMPAVGALGIIIMVISKITKFKPGIVISFVCMFLMTIGFIWQWATGYFFAILSAEIVSNPSVFFGCFSQGLILVIMAWIYHRLVVATYNHLGQKWFVTKSYVITFKLLFYFQLFLLFSWVIAYAAFKAQPLTRLSAQDTTIIAGALALLASGIPAIIYLSKSSFDGSKRHRHVHHRRHTGNGAQKNTETE